ncbi:MAG: transposase [Planctomycetaceae bacterium]|nr:transposase [Planctomycetaceae bacterium]
MESYGVRFGIEEIFKDLKDNYGWGKRNYLRLRLRQKELNTLLQPRPNQQKIFAC